MWSEGTIGIPEENGIMTAFHYWVKHYEEGSSFGIDNGKISKLTLTSYGEEKASYDRGWELEPTDEATKTALAILMKEFN